MKGQRLFVRPATPADHPRITAFFEAEQRPVPPGFLASEALIGFLVGEIVVRAGFRIGAGELRITDFWVARNLRRKRVARAMMVELAGLGRTLGVRRLACPMHPALDEPLRRLGFSPGDGAWIWPLEST